MQMTTQLPPARASHAVILAGGLGRRMGGRDKGLIELDGRPLVAHVIEALRPQARTLMINANRNPDRYASFALPLLPDHYAGHLGPLAGLHAGLREVGDGTLLAVPCDCPRPPADLATRLLAALAGGKAQVAVAHDGGGMQPLFCLLRPTLLPALEAALEAGQLGARDWMQAQGALEVDFSDCAERFANINHPQGLHGDVLA